MFNPNVNVEMVPFFGSVKSPVSAAAVSPSKWNSGCHKDMTVQFYGSATSFAAAIEGTVNTIGADGSNLADADCQWVALGAVNLSTLATVANVTAAGIYEVTIAGVSRVRVNLSAVSGGSLTVVGALGD